MAKICVICGKGKATGNNVSHSKRRTKRTFEANLHKTRVELDGKESTEYVCTRCVRTQAKHNAVK